MKKLLMLLVFCLIGTLAFSQQPKKKLFKSADDIYFSQEKENKKKYAKGDMDQTKWIIESLNKYRKERLTASLVGIAGAGIVGASFAIKDDTGTQEMAQIAGGVLVLIGYIASINAERHLSKKNLTFTGNGLTLRF